jgi:hypothetical protein
MNYKQINCKFCNKTFGINYKYQHDQTKAHQKNIIKEDKKKDLLSIPVLPNQPNEIKDIINILQVNLENLKKILE